MKNFLNQLKISLVERRSWALISAIAHQDLSRKSRVKKHYRILGFSFHFEDEGLNKWDAGVHLQYGTIKFMHAGDVFRILTLTNKMTKAVKTPLRKMNFRSLSRLFSLGHLWNVQLKCRWRTFWSFLIQFQKVKGSGCQIFLEVPCTLSLAFLYVRLQFFGGKKNFYRQMCRKILSIIRPHVKPSNFVSRILTCVALVYNWFFFFQNNHFRKIILH